MERSAARPSACQVCETNRHSGYVYRFADYSVARCSRCGLVYLDGEREVGLFGAVDCFGEEGYLQHLDTDRIAEEQVESVREILTRAGAPLDPGRPGFSVLDVGCARGHFLQHFRSATGIRSVVGIDISKEMTDWGRAQLGLDLRAGHVERAELARGSFDLVTLWDVLEHLPFPRRTLADLLALVKPGGSLVFEVPSERTAFRSLARYGYRLTGGRLSRPVRLLYHTAHLSYFTPRSVRLLAEATGAAGLTMMTKEAHATRFGLGGYSTPARLAIRTLAGIDRALGMEAKLLVAVRK